MHCVIDIETDGLELHDKINFVGVYVPEEDSLEMFWLPRDTHACKARLEVVKNYKTIYHNGKFDTKHIYTHLGIDLPIIHDTMILAYLLSSVPELKEYGKRGWLSLKKVAERWLGVPDWDVATKEKTSKDPAIVLPYLEKDLRYTWQLFETLSQALPQDCIKTYRLIMHASNVYKRIELNGMPINIPQLEETLADLDDELDATKHELLYFKDMNWNSPKQLQAYLFDELGLETSRTTKSGQMSTDVATLKELKGQHPVIEHLLDLRGLEKAVGFLTDWKERAVNGYIHGQFHLCRTVTGRTSCSNPNLQQVPRRKDLKSLFCSIEDDWEFVQIDYSQAELRFASIVADVQAIKDAYRNGEDLHTNMAALISGKERHEVSKYDRTGAKAAKKLAANLTI